MQQFRFKKLIINIRKYLRMKKMILSIVCITMFALFTTPAISQNQPLTGESAPFEFYTQSTPAVPVSPLVVVIVMLLSASVVVYRLVKQKKNVTA